MRLPFSPLKRPLSECRLALVTTGGVHLPEQPRFDIDDFAGDCSYREISLDAGKLTWTHAYYPRPGQEEEDLNCVFPLQTMRELESEGIIGELNYRHFSFVGAIHDLTPLAERTAPEVAEKLASDRVGAVLLTPS